MAIDNEMKKCTIPVKYSIRRSSTLPHLLYIQYRERFYFLLFTKSRKRKRRKQKIMKLIQIYWKIGKTNRSKI